MSLVVPLYNEAPTVDALLAALSRQSVEPGEVVAVDAGSTDGTADRIQEAALAVRVVRAGRLNPGEARNEGVRHATGEWIAFTDGGTRPEPAWLQQLMAAATPEVDVVLGRYDPACDTFYRRCAALAYVPERGAGGVRGGSVASMALRRRVFDAVGGFPAHRASEDLIFLEALRDRGFRIAHAPAAVVLWETARGPAATFRRFALYSRVNLEAGRGRYWHRGVARQYGVVALVLATGLSLGAGAWTWGLVPAWFVARAAKAAWRKRGSFPFPTLRPDHVLGAAAVLAVVDAGTWAGALGWATHRAFRRSP